MRVAEQNQTNQAEEHAWKVIFCLRCFKSRLISSSMFNTGADERERRPVAFHYAPALITRQGRSAKSLARGENALAPSVDLLFPGGPIRRGNSFFFLIKVTTPELVQLHQACRDVVNLKI